MLIQKYLSCLDGKSVYIIGIGVLTSFDALPWSCDMEGLLGTIIDSTFLNQ